MDFIFREITVYIQMGGSVLYLIAALCFLMWTLVVDRIWYYKSGAMQRDINLAIENWNLRTDFYSWGAHKIRNQRISEVREKLFEHLELIKTTVSLAPLFGLLGTVTGMINVFAIMAATGGGDARQMAAGVFSATIPTLSGMVVAISGVFASNYLTKTANKEIFLFEDHLSIEHEK